MTNKTTTRRVFKDHHAALQDAIDNTKLYTPGETRRYYINKAIHHQRYPRFFISKYTPGDCMYPARKITENMKAKDLFKYIEDNKNAKFLLQNF
jgi:hypothetical protein